MDELCSACLCAGRKLYSLSETTFENLYSQIINEIPLFSTMDLHILICWECKALLRRFKQFKEQAKKCYTELLAYEQQNTVKPFGTYPRLQICQLPTESFPQIIKEELEDQSPLDEPMDHEPLGLETLGNEPLGLEPLDHEPLGDDYEVKSEEHFEPETFVNDFNVEKIKKKKVKKVVKPIKQKPKAKRKIKKEKESSIKQQHVSKTVEALIDSTVDDCYNKKEVEEENGEVEEEHRKELEDKMDDVDIEIKIVRALNIKVKNKSKSEAKKSITDKPTCGECGKTFSSKKTYRYHLNVLHKGQNKYPCPRCGKVYQWKSNLGRHMRSHKARDSDELYCELCDKRFASVATYRQHLKISRRHVSEEEFSFMCNECGKKFVNKTRLRDHIDWEHLKKIKFKCQLCNKPFKCHTSLYVHMQNVHRSKDKKDNLCHVCGKSYQNAAKLKYHIIAMHTSETPYQCQQCNAAFGWYSSLYRHVREVHYKMKVQPKKNKKLKKSEMLPSLLPVIPQQICLPQLHQPGPA